MDSEFGSETNADFQFMNETIKKRPFNTGQILKTAGQVACKGILFGVCAAAVFAYLNPWLSENVVGSREQEDIIVLNPTDGNADSEKEVESRIAAGAGMQTGVQENESDPIDDYEKVYNRALEIATEPQKALVTVTNVSDKSDLLDMSVLSNGDSMGILFLQTDTSYYILAENEQFDDAKYLMVTFKDDSTAEGELCRTDEETGLAVVRIDSEQLSEETKQAISVAKLASAYTLRQAKPVIAIGSPTGDQEGVLYGVVTAVSGRLSAADAEYDLITTNMQGSPNGRGVLLDTDGQVIGFITERDGTNTDIVRALSVMQLLPLIETLSNGEDIHYLGIHGVSLSQAQARSLNVKRGIYVNEIAGDSPAMEAGIQRGDVITALDGKKITDMSSYSECLQQLKAGSKVEITIFRRNNIEEYVEINLDIEVRVR